MLRKISIKSFAEGICKNTFQTSRTCSECRQVYLSWNITDYSMDKAEITPVRYKHRHRHHICNASLPWTGFVYSIVLSNDALLYASASYFRLCFRISEFYISQAWDCYDLNEAAIIDCCPKHCSSKCTSSATYTAVTLTWICHIGSKISARKLLTIWLRSLS